MQRFAERGERALPRERGYTAGRTATDREDVRNQDTAEQVQQTFTPGQQVIWLYRISRHHHYHIAVEIVQMGLLRVRIRSRTTEGQTILRWVKPSNLRQWEAGEPSDPYPNRND